MNSDCAIEEFYSLNALTKYVTEGQILVYVLFRPID